MTKEAHADNIAFVKAGPDNQTSAKACLVLK